MKSLLIAALALSLLVFIACNRQGKNSEKTLTQDVQIDNAPMLSKISNQEENKIAVAADSVTVAGDYKKEDEQKEQKQKPPSQKNNHETKIDWDKKIIKTANLDLEVKNYKAFNSKLHESVKQFGGYVSQEEQNESAYKIENTVSIKVPVDQFEDAVSKLTEGGEKIIGKKITSEDVTTEMVDTKSRIEAKKQVRLRYLDLLKQAKNMDEILQVQREINEIQEQLESAAGRVEYLAHSSAFSTINLTFYQVIDAGAVAEKEPTYLQQISESFSEGLKWVSSLLLGLVSLWPLLTLVIILLIAYKKRKSGKIKTS